MTAGKRQKQEVIKSMIRIDQLGVLLFSAKDPALSFSSRCHYVKNYVGLFPAISFCHQIKYVLTSFTFNALLSKIFHLFFFKGQKGFFKCQNALAYSVSLPTRTVLTYGWSLSQNCESLQRWCSTLWQALTFKTSLGQINNLGEAL